MSAKTKENCLSRMAEKARHRRCTFDFLTSSLRDVAVSRLADCCKAVVLEPTIREAPRTALKFYIFILDQDISYIRLAQIYIAILIFFLSHSLIEAFTKSSKLVCKFKSTNYKNRLLFIFYIIRYV